MLHSLARMIREMGPVAEAVCILLGFVLSFFLIAGAYRFIIQGVWDFAHWVFS